MGGKPGIFWLAFGRFTVQEQVASGGTWKVVKVVQRNDHVVNQEEARPTWLR